VRNDALVRFQALDGNPLLRDYLEWHRGWHGKIPNLLALSFGGIE
jgi:hypothetical protein